MGAPMSISQVKNRDRVSTLYQTIWRWHFYAGLICLPFFMMLAVTGALYLYGDRLEGVFERHLLQAPAGSGGPGLPAEALIAAALKTQSGTPVRFTPPPGQGRSAEVGIQSGETGIVDVFLDPATGSLLGKTPHDGRLMEVVSHIHSLAILGDGPNLIIEVVAGWAILLVGSGVYLWWPRGQTGGIVSLRSGPRQRLWWRDLHAVVGIFACAVLLFLALTGMPWSGFWGEQYRLLVNASGLGMPPSVKAGSVASDAALGAVSGGSWTLNASTPPKVRVPDMRDARTVPLAEVMETARQRGLPPGYVIRLPTTAGGVFTLQSYPGPATAQRVIHIDRYSGRVLVDVGFADYGPVSQVTEVGIATHIGKQFGFANLLLMTAGCLAILVMSLAAFIMWWKRRPSGSLGAPALEGPPGLSIFAGAAIATGVLFPLLGLSILAALVIDRAISPLFKLRLGL